MRPSETTSRPVSSSPRKRTSSIRSRVCWISCARLLDELVDVGTGKRRALEQDEHPRERRPQLVRDRRREAGAELLVGRQLGERGEEEDERPRLDVERLLADAPAGCRVPERGRGGRARSDEPPLAVEDDDGVREPGDERS